MFYAVLLLSQLSFGAHLSRSFFTVYAIYLIEHNFFTPVGFGVLLSVATLPSLIAPIWSGWFAENIHTLSSTLFIYSTGVALCQLLFAMSILWSSFFLAAIAWFGFGMCASSVSSLQRAITTYYLRVCAYHLQYYLSHFLAISG